MKKIAILIPVISLFLLSCSNTSNEKSKKQTETIDREEHQHNAEIQTIELNNGVKWKVDAHMMTHIRNMEKDANSYGMGEQKDSQSLSEKLQSNIDLLTSNCTMNGQAHDELHKWLLPYIDLVNGLSKAKDETEAEKQILNIQTSFTVFNQYFQ